MEIEDLGLDEAMRAASEGFTHGECPDSWLDCNQARRIANYFCDPTILTLDVLRQELGEPAQHGRVSSQAGSEYYRWKFGDRNLSYWPVSGNARIGNGIPAKTLGQLRRILSVIREQEADDE